MNISPNPSTAEHLLVQGNVTTQPALLSGGRRMLRHGYEAFTKQKSLKAAMLHSHSDQVMLTSSPNLTFKAQEEPQHTQQLQCRLALPLSSLLIKEKNPKEEKPKHSCSVGYLKWQWMLHQGEYCSLSGRGSTVCILKIKLTASTYKESLWKVEEQGIETMFQVPACLLGAEQNHREAWSAAVTGGFNPGGVMQLQPWLLPGHRILQLFHIPSSAAVPACSLADNSLCLIQNYFFTRIGFFCGPCLTKTEKDSPDQWCRRCSINSPKHAQQFVFFWYLHTSRFIAFCPIFDQLPPLSLWWALTKKGQFLGSHRQGSSRYQILLQLNQWYFLNNHPTTPQFPDHTSLVLCWPTWLCKKPSLNCYKKFNFH